MTKPPLLFIHGMWSTPHVWDWLKARYEAAGHQVHAPALPFHDLDSGAPPPAVLATVSVDDYVDALIAAARDLPAPPIVVGHSMGGMLAQKLGALVDAAGLVLLAPAPTASTVSLAVAPLRTVLGIATTKDWWKSPTRIDAERARWGIFNEVPAEVASEEIDRLVWDSGRVLFQISMPWADSAKATRVDYARLKMPALVMVGDRDRVTPVATARATARALPGDVDYREIEGAGHWLFHDPVRETVAQEMDAFLERVGG